MTGPIALKRFPAGTRLAPVAIDALPSDWATVNYTITIAEHPEKPGVPILVFVPTDSTIISATPIYVSDGAGGYEPVYDSSGNPLYVP